MTELRIVDEILEAFYNEILRHGYTNGVKLIPYFGGDYYVADLILSRLRPIMGDVYVEVFGGSCYIAQRINVMRRASGKPKIIICNDKDRLLYKLYVVIRDRPRELASRLATWPYAREFHQLAVELLGACERDELDDVTCAALMYYVLRASIARFGGGFAVSLANHDHAETYTRSIATLVTNAAQLRGVHFESRDFADLVTRYDREETTFYLDPPYVGINMYRVGFTRHDLHRLAKTLQGVKGRWLLKISQDNYMLIRDKLPPHRSETFEVTSYTEVTSDERRKWTMVLAYA
ncbi:MAG: DNA adenine methylase [Sulfolobales archaeon]